MLEETLHAYPDTCRLCPNPAVAFCRHCGQEFCDKHRSKYNSLLCSNCVRDDNIQTISEPLVEDDGEGGRIVHEGRRIRLIGEGWPNDITTIASLSDDELVQQIAGLQALLELSIQTNDYTRISIAARQFEQGERAHSKRRKLMSRRQEIAQGVVRLNEKRHRMATKESEAEKLAKILGISVEQAQRVINAARKTG